MKKLTLLVLALLSLECLSENEIEKISMSTTSIFNFRQMGLTDSSSQTANPACFTIENGCYVKDHAFPSLVLSTPPSATPRALTAASSPMTTGSAVSTAREPLSSPQDQLVAGILGQLYPDAWATIIDYPEFVVQNFAWDKDTPGGFVVQVDFRLTRRGDTQSMAIFGEIQNLNKPDMMINISGYADLNASQEQRRRDLKSLENNINKRDFVSLMAQVQWQDFKRARAVGATVSAWVSAMRFMPETATTTLTSADIR